MERHTTDSERTFVISNDLDELGRLAMAVEAFGEELGLSPRELYRLNLVLDEVLTNVINYGYEGECALPEARRISVTLGCACGEVYMNVEDDGKPFNPLAHPERDILAQHEDPQVGGLGIHLMKKLMDHMDYRREGGKNRLSIRCKMGCELSG